MLNRLLSLSLNDYIQNYIQSTNMSKFRPLLIIIELGKTEFSSWCILTTTTTTN